MWTHPRASACRTLQGGLQPPLPSLRTFPLLSSVPWAPGASAAHFGLLSPRGPEWSAWAPLRVPASGACPHLSARPRVVCFHSKDLSPGLGLETVMAYASSDFVFVNYRWDYVFLCDQATQDGCWLALSTSSGDWSLPHLHHTHVTNLPSSLNLISKFLHICPSPHPPLVIVLAFRSEWLTFDHLMTGKPLPLEGT